MRTDWQRWAVEAGLEVDENAVLVPLGGGRQQRVRVEEAPGDPETLRLWSLAARPKALAESDDTLLFAWLRNRDSDLVGFKIDRKGWLLGEAWLPLAGLAADEWKFAVLAVARGCDRVEWMLTGADQH